MKKISNLLLMSPLFMLAFFSCDKETSEALVSSCLKGKIIETTCGGTILQILSTKKVGVSWVNNFEPSAVSYDNSVLIGNVPQGKSKGDTIYFEYKEVDHFSTGNFCDIGGLPKPKLEILALVSENCAGNETN
ncbi:MAG: hypothetical protein WKF68_13490 [Daejeonella sp.]